MKPIVACLLCLYLATRLYGQTTVADSLRNAISLSSEDSNRVILIYKLGDEFSISNTDTAFKIALEGLALSRKIGFTRGEMLGLAFTGKMLSLFGNYPEALKSQLGALQIAEKAKDNNWIAEISMNIASIYFFQKDYQHALRYMYKVKEIGEKLNHKEYIQSALENIGAVYVIAEQYDSSLIYTQQALSLAVELRIPVYNMLLNMGHTYSGLNQLGLALEYFRSAMPYINQENNAYYATEAYLGMAKVFEKDGRKDSALIYARKSFAIAERRKYLQGCLDAAAYLTTLYKQANNSDSAFYYSEEAKAANDSLFSQQKINQLQSITLTEQLRLKEKEENERQAQEERKHNLQYAAIAIGLIILLIIFLLLSHSIIVNRSVIRFLAAMTLLIFFEFINLLIHPLIAAATHHSPVGILAFMVCVAALLIPIHHKLEHWMSNRLVEKNNRIRLEAAKRTIEELETAEVRGET